MPHFIQAKKNQQKTSWQAENGKYALFVNQRKIPLLDWLPAISSHGDFVTVISPQSEG